MDSRMPGQEPLFDERARQDQRALAHLDTEQGRAAWRAERDRRTVVSLVLLVLLIIGLVVVMRLL